MGKAVLILDEMPENCSKCPLEYYLNYTGVMCMVLKGPQGCICEGWEGQDKQGRLSDCPLRELPEHRSLQLAHDDDELSHILGWNACLKKLEED